MKGSGVCLSGAIAVAAILTFADAPSALAQGQPAEHTQLAQRDNPISSFFRSIFGGQQQRRPPEQAPQQRQRQAPQQQGRTAPRQQAPSAQPARQATPEPEPAVEKAEDARQVAVFGDFFASGLEAGLVAEFADDRDIVVTGQSNASSGLVRDDFFDWPAAIEGFLEDEDNEVDFAVVMVGGNDRQPLSEAGQTHQARSDRWRELYTQRIDALYTILAEARVPVYWVGLPPVESSRLSQDYAFFNDLYRERAYRAGASYIDIWNSFLGEDGAYAAHGPDVVGEQRQLRRGDGLRFTAAGNRKLAHFVAREIRRDIGSDGEVTADLPRGLIGPRPYQPSEEEEETGVGRVVSLTGTPANALGLAGGPEPPPDPPDDSAYFRNILLGESPDPKPGRSDDFSWPRDREDRREDSAVPDESGASEG